MSYIFGGNTGMTQADVKRRRDTAAALMARQKPARDLGSGLSSIAKALMYRKMMSDADAGETAGRESAAKAFGPIADMLSGGGSSSGNQQGAPAGYDQSVTTGGNGMQDIAPVNPVQAALNRPGEQPQQPQIAPATGSKQIYDRIPQAGQQPMPQPAAQQQQPMPQQPQHNTLLPPEALQAAGMAQGQPQAPQQVAQAPQQPQAQQGGQGQMQQDPRQMISASMQLLDNSFASEAQRAAATEIFKMGFQQLDPAYQQKLKLQAAQLDRVKQEFGQNTPEGQRQVQKIKNDMAILLAEGMQARITVPAEERADLRAQETEKRAVEIEKAKEKRKEEYEKLAEGRKGDVKFNETIAAETAKMIPDMLKAANLATAMNNDLQVMQEVMSGMETGTMSARMKAMFPSFDAATAFIKSKIDYWAPRMRVEGSGSTSDIETRMMVDTYPKIENLPGANALIFETMMNKNALDKERGQIASGIASGDINRREGLAKLSELNQRSVMSPKLQEMISRINGGPIQNSSNALPAGVTQAEFDAMTPEERAVFQ